MSLISASRCLPAAWIFSRSGTQVVLADVLGLLLEHLAVADDGVERRAQLVAHVGQEGALGPVGGLGRVLGALSSASARLRSVMSRMK